MKVVVFTLGCKVNSCESNSLINKLKEEGYEVSEELGFADIYVINTCAVTQEAEKKSRQAVARVKKYNKDAKIIITGCASQNNPESFASKEGVTLVTGTKAKDRIISLINDHGIHLEQLNKDYDDSTISKAVKTRHFLKVQDGCNNFCTYCIIPYLRGRSRSRSVESIVEEINKTTSLEIVLTAIDLSDYNYNGIKLNGLIDNLTEFNQRIRLGSLEEGVVNREFLQSLKNLKNFAPHFHLSLQSGSDKVLKKMNRKYLSSAYLDSVKLIREYFPLAGITTDIIVGFPAEGDEEFNETINFAKECEFSDIHCFPYSPRKGTMSYTMKDIPSAIKDKRMDEILQLKEDLRQKFFNRNLGKLDEVLFEEFDGEYSNGYTGNYIKVYVKGNFVDIIKNVKLTGIYKDGVLGEIY